MNIIVNTFRDDGRVGNLGENCALKTTQEEDNAMVKAFRDLPLMTASEIRDLIGLVASDELVRQRLRGAGLRKPQRGSETAVCIVFPRG